jgi:hypothetical protein
MKKFKLIIASLIAFLSILLNIYQMNENPKINPVDTIDTVKVDTNRVLIDTTFVNIVSDITN